MSNSVFSIIRTKYNTLSDSQKRVADYVLANADKVMLSSLSELASAILVSETTVIRFLRKLGYDSYQVFRVNIAQELSSGKAQNIYGEILQDDCAGVIIQKVVESTARSIRDSAEVISPEMLDHTVDLILGAQSIFLIGIGASAAPAFDLQHKLLKLGLNACFCHDPHMINIRCSILKEGALLIAFSHSGESREILDGVRCAKAAGAAVTAVTSYPKSSLATAADALLLSSSQEMQYRSDSMISRIIQMTIIDMIYVRCALKMGGSAHEFINRSSLAVAKNKT